MKRILNLMRPPPNPNFWLFRILVNNNYISSQARQIERHFTLKAVMKYKCWKLRWKLWELINDLSLTFLDEIKAYVIFGIEDFTRTMMEAKWSRHMRIRRLRII